MKKLKLVLAYNLFLIVGLGQGIIIDHTCSDITQIPSIVIDDIKTNIRFQWCGQSHSNQIPCGLGVLESIYPQFNSEVQELVLPTNAEAMNVYIGTQGFDAPGECCTSVTPEGYWKPPTGPEWTNDLLTYNPTLNVSGFLWCWQLEGNISAYVQSYLDQMEIFEATYPNVTFVYTTGNAQAYYENGITRATNNAMIRNYCITHNKVLFDFEDLDSWYDGEQHTDTYNGVTYPVQHDAYNGQDCGHVNYLGAEYKARAIWWMMARLVGWNPTLTDNPNVSLNQSFNITLYPNPAAEFINVEINNPMQDLVTIYITDLEGNLILVDEWEALDPLSIKKININTLNKGFYLVKIKTANNLIFKKFIKI